jgi:phosphoglucomutase
MPKCDNEGEFILLNGNQTGSLLIYYLLNAWEQKGKLTGNEYIVSTIVTTQLIGDIAKSKNVSFYETLTGFKWIGALITEFQGKKTFIAGGEESYGYLVGELVRDKDAVISCAFIAEMAAFYKDQGSSLYQTMLKMYQTYGFYKEKLVSITKKGKTGAEEIKSMMERFRVNTPESLGGSKVICLKDYELGKETDLLSGNSKKLDFPKSDVLQFITEDGCVISARPSGTEPKIKFYCSVKTALPDVIEFENKNKQLDQKIEQIIQDLAV